MSDPSSQPTQPLTDEELAVMQGAVERADLFDPDLLPIAFRDRKRLLAEVVRLRADLAEARLERAKKLRPVADELHSLKDYVIGHADGGTFPSETLLNAFLERVATAHVRALGLDQDGRGQANAR
jgi:hypothetical protein